MTVPVILSPLFSYPAAPGALLHTYAAGGTTPLATYSDAAGSVPNANPVVLDSTGSAIVRGTGAYHLLLKDSTDTTTLYDEDQILSGLGNVTYSTDTGLVNAMAIANPVVSGTTGSSAKVIVNHTNTSGTVTLAVNGGSASPVILNNGLNPAVGAFIAGQILDLIFNGTDWICTNLGTLVQAASGASTVTGALTVDGSASTPEVAIGNSSTAFTLDVSKSNTFSVLMTGNVATMTVSNPSDGQTCTLFIKQGAGPFTLAWPASFLWAGGSAGAISTVNTDVDMLVITYRSATSKWYASLLKAFA